MWLWMILALMFSWSSPNAEKRSSDFVIDESKPYVYIAFDHVGSRVPLSKDEVPTGLWLRVVNNCKVPISLRTFDPATHDPGVGVLHEIVASHTIPPPGPGIVGSEKPPVGYSAEILSYTIIPPGESLLFSVPSNHVSQHWYLRVQFELEPANRGSGPQPYSFVDFTWAMIPQKDR